MGERPILFSGAMVRAILESRKTQTRRVVKPQPPVRGSGMRDHKIGFATDDEGENLRVYSQSAGSGSWSTRCPYGQPGDRLWVRESFCLTMSSGIQHYRADQQEDGVVDTGYPWRPSIHMRREHSRITLEVTGVRVERLQAISPSDCAAEGIEVPLDFSGSDPDQLEELRSPYRALWDSINAKRAPWSSNPWVWVVEFKRLQASLPLLKGARPDCL